MKVPIRLAFWAFTASLLATGCESGQVVDPENRSGGGKASVSSERYSDWSDPVTLGPLINSAFNDQQPALSKDGLSLYFASNRPTNASDAVPDQNIWVAQRACTGGCAWTTVDVLPAVNTEFLDASPSLSRDGHQLFFTSQRPHGHCSPPATQCTNRDLWVSYRENVQNNFGWQDAVNLGDGINSSEEEVAPSYFENDDAGAPQLFFNRGELVGDIYTSRLTNGVWSAATEVSEVNGDFSDQRPSISHDGKELYFWSNRPSTEGGPLTPQIWLARRQGVDDPWFAPQLVPAPISGAETIMPFIHSHGRTETLLFVRPFSPVISRDLWMSERTRSKGSE